jgi:hypothetical protein
MMAEPLDDPALFTNGFRGDITFAVNAPESAIQAILPWLKSLPDTEAYADDDSWVPLSRATGLSIDDLQRITQPLVWIASRSTRRDTDAATLLKSAFRAAALSEEELDSATGTFLQIIGELLRLLSAAPSIARRLPFPYLDRVSLRIALSTAFDKEFSYTRDQAESYSPRLVLLQPLISLNLLLKDKATDPVAVLLTPQTLAHLINALQLAQKQVEAACSRVDARLLAGQERSR